MKYVIYLLALAAILAAHDVVLVKNFQSYMKKRVEACYAEDLDKLLKERPKADVEDIKKQYTQALLADCMSRDVALAFYGIK
jgi:hypothetical protein